MVVGRRSGEHASDAWKQHLAFKTLRFLILVRCLRPCGDAEPVHVLPTAGCGMPVANAQIRC
jgi:hypothetical protein